MNNAVAKPYAQLAARETGHRFVDTLTAAMQADTAPVRCHA
jgi:hypothetical protein